LFVIVEDIQKRNIHQFEFILNIQHLSDGLYLFDIIDIYL